MVPQSTVYRTMSTNPKMRTSIRTSFLPAHGRHCHPAFDARSPTDQAHCDSLQEKDGPCPYIFRTLIDNHTKKFIKAVEAHKNGLQDPRVRAISLRGKISWEQVMQQVRQAEERYQLAGKSGIRRIASRASDESPTVIPYLTMSPNDSMSLPAVGGGLRLIFEVETADQSSVKTYL